MISRSTDIRAALRSRQREQIPLRSQQRGFLLNPFRFGGGGATVYNSFQATPVPIGISGTLSNSNRTWTTNTAPGSGGVNANYVTPVGSVPGTKKAYWEMTVATLSAADTGYVYFQVNGSYIWYVYGGTSQIAGNSVVNISAGASGMVLMFAVDGPAGKLWYGRNGTWLTVSGTPDPAAGTGQALTFTPGTDSVIQVQGRTGSVAQVVNCNFGHAAWTYTPPTGFTSINA